MKKYYAGIEAGGTKFVCIITDHKKNIIKQTSISTRSPQETMPQVIDFFRSHQDMLIAMGIGAFGPVDIHSESSTYGTITHTPKISWRNFNLLDSLKSEFDMPMIFDTDVNAAAYGEHMWGAAQGLTDFLYITIGTGIGVGGMTNGKLIHGLTHPEMGHILIQRSAKELKEFTGICPSHGNCLEGMASGTAINARWNIEHCSTLQPNHSAWELEADYLAQALMNYTLICSPQKIIMGGGVMKQTQLFPMIQEKLQERLNGYVQHPLLLDNIGEYIVPPKLDSNAGSLGAIALAMKSTDIQ